MRIRAGVLAGVLGLVVASGAQAQASHYVQGHYRADGTYVQGHYRSNPNQTRQDNYSTQGNYNPYTGRQGTQPQYNPTPTYQPYRPPETSSYQPYRPQVTQPPPQNRCARASSYAPC